MAAYAVELNELGIDTRFPEPFRQLALLMQREKNIGLDADDEHALELQFGKAGLE